MKHSGSEFPLVVGLATTLAGPISEGLLVSVKDVFRKLRAQSQFGVCIVYSDLAASGDQIAHAAKEAGVACRAIEASGPGGTPEPEKAGLTMTDIELVDTSDVVIFVSSGTPSAQDPFEDDLVGYAKTVGRPVISIEGKTGALRGGIPERIEREESWLPELFSIAGLALDADLQTIKAKMSAVANRVAPLTRRRWNWILLLQGLAVILPLGWLIRREIDISPRGIAFMVLSAVTLLVALNWWLRWRGMQKTWARSRLVAEHARSLLATTGCPQMPALQSLAMVPALRPLRWVARHGPGRIPFPEWRDFYIGKQVDGQIDYFTDNQTKAEIQRGELTRWATILLDIALAFAFAGAFVAFAPNHLDWIRRLGGERFEILLGIAGVVIPLGLLLVQILRSVQELNRRTARFAQQRQMLLQAKSRLITVRSPELAMELIETTERQLLAEVLDWYFRAETAEHFFNPNHFRGQPQKLKRVKTGRPSTLQQFSLRVLARTGTAGFFLLRVILGRIPWFVGSAVVVLLWLMYRQPSDLKSINQLKVLAELKERGGQTWDPSPARAERGCVVIVHGLQGQALLAKLEQKKDWMEECADTIAQATGGQNQAPNICLVDWAGVATPSKIYGAIVDTKEGRLVQDVVNIRNQAREVGNELGFRLALALGAGKIRRDRPLHLIGHSAGGFVIARAVKVLSELGLAPADLRVTILDTPAPDDEVLSEVPKICPTDFYISSPVGGRNALLQLEDFSSPNMHMKELSPPPEMHWLDKHRWAYTWYIETVIEPKKWPNEGFNLSPLLPGEQPKRSP